MDHRGRDELAIRPAKAAPQRLTLADVTRVVGLYVEALELPTVLPWLASKRAAFVGLGASVLTLVLIEAVFVDPLGRAMLVLPLLGIAASAASAWHATAEPRPDLLMAREAALRAELDVVADQRVALVIRQFEWAVNDVETLRQVVRKAETAKTAADTRIVELERRARQYRHMLDQAQTQLAVLRAAPLQLPKASPQPAAPTGLTFRWGLHDDGAMRWLQLQGDAIEVSRIRLLDGESHVVTISDRAVPVAYEAGRLGVAITMGVPPHVVGELVSGDVVTHCFQAMQGDEWLPIELVDSGERTSSTRDKRGRLYGDQARSA
jgi:hypothetical protein